MTEKEMSKGKNLSPPKALLCSSKKRVQNPKQFMIKKEKDSTVVGNTFCISYKKNYLERLSFNLFQLQCCILNSKFFCMPKLDVFQSLIKLEVVVRFRLV